MSLADRAGAIPAWPTTFRSFRVGSSATKSSGSSSRRSREQCPSSPPFSFYLYQDVADKRRHLPWEQDQAGALPAVLTISLLTLPGRPKGGPLSLKQKIVVRVHTRQPISHAMPAVVTGAIRSYKAEDGVRLPGGQSTLLSSKAEPPTDNRQTPARYRQKRPSLLSPLCLSSYRAAFVKRYSSVRVRPEDRISHGSQALK